MASLAIDNKILRVAPFPDLAKYFKQLLAGHENEKITDYLLAGVATDSLPFRSIAVWITGFADARSIAKSLRYEKSAGVRRLAIKRFARCLRNEKRMHAVFDAVGGVFGLVELFTELSVHDVQSFCQALGRTCTWNVAKGSRQALLTEFTQSLIFKDKNPETRTFIKFYANIVPGCTVDFVRAWEENATLPRAGGRWMDHAHYQHTRERCMKHLFTNKGKDFTFKYFENVFYELPPLPAGNCLSQSMQYSLDILDFLGEHEEIEMLADHINDNIFAPLIRRLNKRRAPHAVRARVLRAVEKALRLRVHEVGIVDVNQHGPLRNVISCWNSDSENHEQLLIDIMHLVPARQHHVALDRVGTLLSMTRKSLRYRLLVLATKHLKPLSKDLEIDSELSQLGPWPATIFSALPSEDAYLLLQKLIRLRPKDAWPAEIFTALSPEHASSLLRELLKLRPSGDFIQWASVSGGLGDMVFSIPHNADVTVLQLYVAPASVDKDKSWRALVDERKKEGARAREQSDRATWARSAILCSAASGSLDCFEETLIWARRFNRDALTVKEIYNNLTIRTSSSIRLLSGIPSKANRSSASVDRTCADVKHGNRILMHLLETAFQGIREPSFQSWDWKTVLGMFKLVIEYRMNHAHDLQDRLSLSDDKVYEVLWEDTLQMLLTAEQQCLADEHQKLAVDQPVGLSGRLDVTLPENKLRQSQAKFLDELAKRRNEIWEKRRIAMDPNVLSLTAPFPRGLAFQDLLRCESFEGSAGRLPYLESRAESIVFAASNVALSPCPQDELTQKAIRDHVDDYNQALEFYVDIGVDIDDRKRRKQKAWAHALGPLSKPRGMSALQAKLFWGSSFAALSPTIEDEHADMPSRPDPAIPNVADPEESTEWHPDPNPSQWTTKSVPLEPTCLDLMLERHTGHFHQDGLKVDMLEPVTAAITPQPIWQDFEDKLPKSVVPASRESLAALGLMLINSKCCSRKRLFSSAFPGADDARFPAMYLDEDFLEREEISEEVGFTILERLSKDVPLTLVAELCETMLSNLGAGGDPKRQYEEETLRLLKILVESDRPDLTLDLVRKVVINRPDASSWHRHMLTPGLFSRLKSRQAREFLKDTEKEIVSKLQEQAQRKPVADEERTGARPPLVKVTTVTALAQLLAKATFVSADEAVDLLVDLFANARHPDICVAIMESLTKILRSTKHESVKAKVIDALVEHAVPIASSMNERSPMSEADWQSAETKLEVPEVNEPHSKGLQPVLRAITDAYSSLSTDIMPEVYRRILLPILDISAVNNHRWMRLFLRKHNLHCRVENLPLVPPKPYFLPTLLRRDAISRRDEIFAAWVEAVSVNLNPPLDIFQINNSIMNNKDLLGSNGGKHWLSLWHNPGTSALSITGTQLHGYLDLPKHAAQGALPISLIQDQVFEQLELTIREYDSRSSEYEHIIQQLARPRHKIRSWEDNWDSKIRPVIERIVDRIDSIRNLAWQRQSHRVPATLPDTFELRLGLLTWPGYDVAYLSEPGHERKVSIFATELSDVIASLASSGTPYHTHFAQIKAAALAIHPQDFAPLALHLGRDWQALRLQDYLRVEIAEALFQKIVEPESAERKSRIARDVRLMVESWVGSADEVVRMAGIRTERVFDGYSRGSGYVRGGRGNRRGGGGSERGGMSWLRGS